MEIHTENRKFFRPTLAQQMCQISEQLATEARDRAFVRAFWALHRSYAAMGMARTCVPTIEGMPQHFCPMVSLVGRLNVV